jgi:ABC-type multidrug transport system fused ATPase/permease subunit
MNQYKVDRYVFLSVVGFAIFAAGLVMIKLLPEVDDILRMLPYLCMGVGLSIFSGNFGTVIMNIMMMKNPQATKQMEIQQKDERNQSISNRAKAKAYDLTILVYFAILLAFSLMNVDMYVLLTLAAAYLFSLITNSYYRVKYSKKM